MTAVYGAAMNDDRLTEKLASLILGWKATPDRFIKTGRSWIPRWRFRPFAELTDAFRLLDHAADHYILTGNCSTFAAEVQIDSCWGKVVGEHKARTITLAVARALQLEVDE
jgi:hypothetical protein